MDRDTGAVLPLSELDQELAGPTLEPGEKLIEHRTWVRMRQADAGVATDWVVGDLYLTDVRLLHTDGIRYAVALTDIFELTLAGPRLLLSLRGGAGLVIEHPEAAEIRASIAGQLKLAQNLSR